MPTLRFSSQGGVSPHHATHEPGGSDALNLSATSRILGRKTAGAGSVEECTLSEVLDFVGSAAQGDILYRGASGWTRLAAGTSGQFLKTQGAGANPTWAAAGGGEAFPVGSVFIAVVSTNPNTLLGYGTWSAFAAGRVLVGLNAADADFDTVEETGGAKTHTLVASEMPSHTHTQNAHTHTQNAHTHTVNVQNSAGSTNCATGDQASSFGTFNSGSTTATNQNTTPTNQNTGGGGAHNNLQPYIVVYMWKRTA